MENYYFETSIIHEKPQGGAQCATPLVVGLTSAYSTKEPSALSFGIIFLVAPLIYKLQSYKIWKGVTHLLLVNNVHTGDAIRSKELKAPEGIGK